MSGKQRHTARILKVSHRSSFILDFFINDTEDGMKSKLSIFADETKIINGVGTKEDIAVLEGGRQKIRIRSVENKMNFSEGKCNVMHCGKRNTRDMNTNCMEMPFIKLKMRKTEQ